MRALGALCTLLLLASCTDSIYDELLGLNAASDEDGISFSTQVQEQADLIYSLGSTRAGAAALAADSAFLQANANTVMPLKGDNVGQQLYVHRKPLPLFGIHPHTVRAASTDQATRASASDIIQGGADAINFHDSLTIWGMVYNGEHYRPLFNQVLLKKVRGFRSSVHWPYTNTTDGTTWNGQSMRFFALAPAYECLEDLSINGGFTYAAGTGITPPTFTYTVPDDPAAQRDLLLGMSPVIDVQDTIKEDHLGQDDKEVSLTFKHILTCIRFAQGKMPTNVTIKSITLQHITNKGTCTCTPDASTRSVSWTESSDAPKVDYTLTTSYKAGNWEGSTNTYIANDQVLFLLPHILSDQALLEVKLTDATGKEHTLTRSLEHDLWEPGYTVTYSITIGEVADDYYLFVGETASKTGSTQEKAHEQTTAINDGTFTIHSYHNFLDYSHDANGAATHVGHGTKWKITGFSKTSDGGYTLPKPNWLTSIDGWNNGPKEEDGGDVSLSYQIQAQSSPYQNLSHTSVLRANQTVSGIDLSQKQPDGTKPTLSDRSKKESANSYIVNATGSYNFPAVYGNALQGGTYSSGYDEYVANTLNPDNIFVDHRGAAIKKAYVRDQTDEVSTANADESTLLCLTDEEKTNSYTAKIVKEEYLYDYKKNTESVLGDMQAELIWTDTNSSVFSGIKYDDVNKKIVFSVTNPVPCNAVIALKGKKTTITTVEVFNSSNESQGQRTSTSTSNDFEILWTYHIWVTDEVYPNNLSTTYKSGYLEEEGNEENENRNVDLAYPSYNSLTSSKIARLTSADGTKVADIMPVNLGWVPTSDIWNAYEKREIWVKIQQVNKNNDGGYNEITLKIRQEARPELITGTSTIYQWGRPNALPMTTTVSKADRSIYNNSGTDIRTSFVSNTVSSNYVQTAIATPLYSQQVSGKNEDWWDTSSEAPAFWNASKTLYDPCPPGFQLPAGSIFTGFSLTGNNIENASSGADLNIWKNSGAERSAEISQGAYIYTKAHSGSIPAEDRYGNQIYVPASGVWRNFGINEESTAFFWTHGKNDSNKQGLNVRLRPQKGSSSENHNYFLYNEQTSFSTALPIRPVSSE